MEEQRFLFSSCIMVDNQLFFIEIKSGLPARMNPDRGNVVYCDIMDGFMIETGDVVDFIDCYKNKIYMLETSGANLVIMDFTKKQCWYLELNCTQHAWGNFAAFERYESFYYIFPKYGNKIFVLNTNSNEITELSNCFDSLEEIQCTCRVKNQVWILPKNTKRMYVFDLMTQNVKYFQLKGTLENCVDAIWVGTDIYILSQFGLIYKWDINNEDWNKITVLETEHDENESMCRIVYASNQLILFPALGRDIKILDLSTNETKVYHDYPSDHLYHEMGWSKYHRSCEDNEYYYFAMRLGNYLLKICKKNGSLLWIKPQLPTNEEKINIQKLMIEQKVKLHRATKGFIYEGKGIGMNIFHMLYTNFGTNCVEGGIYIGKKIYETMR